MVILQFLRLSFIFFSVMACVCALEPEASAPHEKTKRLEESENLNPEKKVKTVSATKEIADPDLVAGGNKAIRAFIDRLNVKNLPQEVWEQCTKSVACLNDAITYKSIESEEDEQIEVAEKIKEEENKNAPSKMFEGVNIRSKNAPEAQNILTNERVAESSMLDHAPRILTCCKENLIGEGYNKIPPYAHELSQWVLNRRLSQLPQNIDKELFKDILKERFDYRSILTSVTSNAVFDHGNYRITVHHTDIDDTLTYYSVFDVFLKDAPQKLWIEGEMRASDIRFEEGGFRDVHSLNYFFTVLIDELFPNNLLKEFFSGRADSEEAKNQGVEKFTKEVLSEDMLNRHLFWGIALVPFCALPSNQQY